MVFDSLGAVLCGVWCCVVFDSGRCCVVFDSLEAVLWCSGRFGAADQSGVVAGHLTRRRPVSWEGSRDRRVTQQPPPGHYPRAVFVFD